jgi:hypothetical protein
VNVGSIWAEIRIKTDQLQADITKAQELMTAAEKSTEAATAKISSTTQVQMAALSAHMETVANKIKTAGQNISKIGTPLLIAGAAITAVVGLIVKAAAAGEVAETRLATALKATSQYSDANVKSLIKLSENMADLSGISHDTIQQMMGFGLQLGFSKEQVEKLTPKILDYASATGKDLETSIRLAKAAMEGNVGALARVGIYIEKAKNGTVDFNSVLNAFASYAGSAKAKGETLTGQIAILKERFDRLAETLGTTLIPIIKDLIDKYLIPFIDKISTLPPRILENIIKFTALTGVLLLVGGGFMKLIGFVTSFISSIILLVSKLILAIPSIQLFATSVNAALGPVGWIALAITALTGLILYLKKAFDQTDVSVQAVKASIEKNAHAIDMVTQGQDKLLSKQAEAADKMVATTDTSVDKMIKKWKDYEDAIKAALARQVAAAQATANKEAEVAQEITDLKIAAAKNAVNASLYITAEGIDKELAQLAAAQQQKERQAWIDAETEKLLVAKDADEEAAIRKEIQQQYDAWQYEDNVSALNRRKTLVENAAQKELEAKEKLQKEIEEAEQKTIELELYYEQEANRQIREIEQRKVDLRASIESNLVEYLRDLHQREMDFAIKAIGKERDAKLKAIDKEMDAVQKQYDDAIDKINGERDARLGIIDEKIAALQKEHEAAARVETLAELKKAVAEAETPEERARAEKDLNRQIAEWAYEDKFEALQKEADAVRALAEEKVEIATKEYEDKKKQLQVELEDVQKYYNDQLTATQDFYDDLMLIRNLDAEAQKLLATKTNKEILDILRATKSEWAALGSAIGDAFWSNLIGGITNLEALLTLLGEWAHGGGRGHAAFAEGGEVYGPTLALLGETATPSNPEIIIPPGKSVGGMSVIYNIYGASDILAVRQELKIHDKELLDMMRGGRW